MSGKRFNPEKAERLYSPERRKLLPVQEILQKIDVQPDDVFADLGAGNGYFTVPIAKSAKAVYAVDIEPKMLEMLKDYAGKEQVSNIEYVTSNLEAVNMEKNTVNKVFSAFVLHEIDNLEKAFNEMKRIMTKSGELYLLDWEMDENPEMGPPSHERIPSDRFVAILKDNGFEAEILYNDKKTYGIKASVK